MYESILTVLTIGFLAGFFLSMPIAGPISIMVVCGALKENLRYCVRLALGASIIEFFYVFIVVYGMAGLYGYYSNYIPYILAIGSLFLFFMAYKIVSEDFNIDKLNATEKGGMKGGLRTGMLLNLTNPTLLLGWLASSFMVLSFAASLGLNTGGLDLLIGSNTDLLLHKEEAVGMAADKDSSSNLLLAAMYALGVAVGCYVWFYILSKIIIKNKMKIPVLYINRLTKFLGFCLFGIGIYLIIQAVLLLVE